MRLERADEAEVQRGAAERGHAPDEALELKMLKDVPIFINVRFAGIIETAWLSLSRAGGSSASFPS